MIKELQHKFWTALYNLSDRKIKLLYLKEHGFDSCCPQCKQWESHGNVIKTEPMEDGSENRSCSNCGYSWKALFTPAGFVRI